MVQGEYFQSSVPCVPSSARKISDPFSPVRSPGLECSLEPGLISATWSVPVSVPSLVQSSYPSPYAVKKSRVPSLVNPLGEAVPLPTSLTSCVPVSVPLVIHRSELKAFVFAKK